jgi:hypothetical protein
VKITEHAKDRLVIEAGAVGFARALLVLFIVSAAAAAAFYLYDPRATNTDRFWGTLAAAVLFLVGFLAVYERAQFVFNRATRELLWHRRRAFTNRSGKVPFAQIRGVVMQTTGNRINPSKRVTLLVPPDEEIPLSVGYAPDPSGSYTKLQETIEQFMGNDEP